MKTKISSKISTFILVLLALILYGALNIKAAPGDLDQTFGSGGKVVTDFNGADYITDIALQPDGKVVVVGGSYIFDDIYDAPRFMVARYNSNGSLDNSFGDSGKFICDYCNPSGANSVAIQPDGKIVVAGSVLSLGSNNNYNFFITRFNSDGSLDSAFGGGIFTTDFFGYSDSIRSIVIQPDGKIVAAGHVGIEGSKSIFGLIRYNANGFLDSTFGIGGKVTTSFNGGQFDSAVALVLQANGKLVAAGRIGDDVGLARYNSDGSLDPTFGNGGIVITNFAGQYVGVAALVLQADGKLVAAGKITNDFGLLRYHPDGSLDSTFGSGGKVTTDFHGSNDGINKIVLQTDGKIVAAGYVYNNDTSDFGVARYKTNGTLDTTFGTGGKITTDFSSGDDEAGSIVLQPNGGIIAAGNTYVVPENFYSSDFALARYLVDSVFTQPTLFDFDGDGKADISVFRPTDRTWYLNQSTNGFSSTQFGLSTDKITPADFDGDRRTDIAVFRDGTWYWLNSSNGNLNAVQFGQSGDIPVPADYTGDGRAEIAVYRSGFWYTLNLVNNQFQAAQFGNSTDKPVVSDYDGDGRADYAVYREGFWYLNQSTQGFAAVYFGLPTDRLVPADYDGDGKTDVAVYRDGTWYVQQSNQGFTAFQFGLATDVPAPADYDGDGKTDAAVFRDGVWYLRQSANGFSAVQFGFATDKSVPSAYLP
jgi:uncharacterized delta-60 repeat protein